MAKIFLSVCGFKLGTIEFHFLTGSAFLASITCGVVV